jgi:glycosyltransferase involved in cell wall biosynthesis
MGPREILYIAYPLLAVSAESCGGAEQLLHTLEAAIAARGPSTAVAACEGSRVAGELLPTGAVPAENDQLELRQLVHRENILSAIAERARMGRPFDLVHDHSGCFWENAGDFAVPVLVTLHLPRYMYPQERFLEVPAHVFFNCVSTAQAAWFRGVPNLAGVVENGIDLERFPLTLDKGEHVLWLGRFCLEKGPHIAIEVASRAGMPLVLAGQVYPFSYHEQFFSSSVRPHLDGRRVRLLERPNLAEKVELLRKARAVVIPSLVDETSSLVAMEAMACGTPVIAFRRGGLAEVVRHGETGFLVDTIDEMVEALARTAEIDPLACRRHVESRYSAARMARNYELLYQQVLERAAMASETGVAAD